MKKLINKLEKLEQITDRNFLLVIFEINILLCFLLSNFTKSLFLSADEMRYIGLARSIANGDGFTWLHHMQSSYQKILYPLLISPAFLFQYFRVQMRCISLINAILMSSAIFPIWLLGKEYIQKKSHLRMLCMFGLLLPEFAMTMTFMSENLYFPMVVWEIYLIQKLFQKSEKTIRWAAALGIWTYLLYLCKEIGIAFLLGYLIWALWQLVSKKENGRQALGQAIVACALFAGSFLLAKETLFRGMGNSYNQMSLGAILSWKSLGYFIYACCYYLVYIVISFYFFPVWISLWNRKKLQTQTRKMMEYLVVTIVLMVAVVGYTISIREDLGSLSPHLHLRYFAPLIIPVLLVFYEAYWKQNGEIKGQWYKRILMFTLVILVIIPNICQRGLMDSQSMEFYRVAGIALTKLAGSYSFALNYLVVKAIWMGLVLLGFWMLRKDKEKFALWFLSFTFLFNLVNYALKYIEVRIYYSIDASVVDDMQSLNDELDSLYGNKLIVGRSMTDSYMELADTYLLDEDLYYTSISSLQDWDGGHIPCVYPESDYKDLNQVTYYIVDNSMIEDGTVNFDGKATEIWQNAEYGIWYYEGNELLPFTWQ